MYLLNIELEVNWYILTGAAPPVLADLDVTVIDPDGISNYTNSGILIDDYIPSTDTTKGMVTFRFTPNKKGLWKVKLSEGTSDNNTEYYTHDIMVSINDTNIKKFVDSSHYEI